MSQVRAPITIETTLDTIKDNNNIDIYMNLARAYEAEFSILTHKAPNEIGIFEPDTILIAPYTAIFYIKIKLQLAFVLLKSLNI